jgi:hypothetical protein
MVFPGRFADVAQRASDMMAGGPVLPHTTGGIVDQVTVRVSLSRLEQVLDAVATA